MKETTKNAIILFCWLVEVSLLSVLILDNSNNILWGVLLLLAYTASTMMFTREIKYNLQP